MECCINSHPPLNRFSLTTGTLDELSSYQYNKKIVTHYFCPVCGSQMFIIIPPLGIAAVNVNTVDDIDTSSLIIEKRDGKSRNNRWSWGWLWSIEWMMRYIYSLCRICALAMYDSKRLARAVLLKIRCKIWCKGNHLVLVGSDHCQWIIMSSWTSFYAVTPYRL